MKMNLSVVMGMVDRYSAPLKDVVNQTDRFSKKIQQAQQLQQEDASGIALIENYKKMQQAAEHNALAIATAKERLAQLQEQAARPPAALNKQLNDTKAQIEVLTLAHQRASEAAEQGKQQLAQLQAKAQSNPSVENQAQISAQQEKIKQLTATAQSSAQALAQANDKLFKLNEKATKPSARLTEQLTKQEQKLSQLTETAKEHKAELNSLSGEMTKVGIDSSKLSEESQRLESRYEQHGKAVDKLKKRYDRWSTTAAMVQRINQKTSFTHIGKSALSKGGAIVSGLAMGGLVQQMSSASAEIGKLADKASNLQLPIEELQAMQSQAEQNGVSADGLSASMTRFTRRLGVLQKTGGGAFGGYLKSSRNSLFRDLKAAKNNQEAYEMLLVAFSKLKTTQEQMAFSDAAFGDTGREMLMMLRQGTEGLTAAREAFNALGGGISEKEAKIAGDYGNALTRIKEILRNLKFAALTPIMQKANVVLEQFIDKFRNADYREEVLAKISKTVEGLYQILSTLGRGAVWISQNIKTFTLSLAAAKVAMIALNFALMANPMGLVVSAVSALVLGVMALANHLGFLEPILSFIETGLKYIAKAAWFCFYPLRKFAELLGYLPDSLFPDWLTGASEVSDEIKGINQELGEIKDKNVSLGIQRKEDTIKKETVTTRRYGYSSGSSDDSFKAPAYAAYQPIAAQSINSKSEVALTIKSDKPVTIDKAKSDKKTDINLDVGNMSWSY